MCSSTTTSPLYLSQHNAPCEAIGMIANTSRSIVDAPILDVEGNLVAELQQLDLTLNEARILLFLLTQGQSNASDISLQTGIQRTETYNYISNLLSKEILFRAGRGGCRAAHPVQEKRAGSL